MERSQEKFILEQLNTYPVCEIKEKYTESLAQVSTPAVRNILNQKFVSGSDMKAVLCLFDTLFLASQKKRDKKEKGLFNLSRSIQQWVKKMDKLPVDSAEGFVYITDFFSEDIQVVIKVPRRASGFETMVREYYIGITSLNKLRYLIPTFVYTLGAFLCPTPTKTGKLCTGRKKNTAFVMYEKVPGTSMDNLLTSREISFNQWLLVFFQLLLGLEIAQRETRFTHFDLHTGNVMVRRTDTFSYTVPLDDTSYSVNDPELLPVVIDFGMATTYVAEEDHYVGSFMHARHGMLNFMVPGADMYKFMTYSAAYAKDPVLKRQIRRLFRFYGDDDPYNISSDPKGVKKSTHQYCREATFSAVATYTPLMLAEWLWREYRTVLQPSITVSDRMEYLPLRYSSTIKEYDDIFQHSGKGRERAIKLADECLYSRPSYVMTKYNATVLERYNEGLQSPDLASRIKGINMYLDSSESLLAVDMAMLEKVFDIYVPEQEKVRVAVQEVLNIRIRNSDPSRKREAVDNLNILSYQSRLHPYLQFYYTILELNLEDKFTDWIQRFKASDIYRLYVDNVTENERAIRWGQTLMASIS